MKVICWYPALTDHQSFTIEELKRELNGNLEIYVFSSFHKVRSQQGWMSSHADASSKQLISGFKGFKFILKVFTKNEDAIHLFGSPFENLKIIATLVLAILFKQKIYLISEPYSYVEQGYLDDQSNFFNKLKLKLRPVLYKFYGCLLRKRLEGVFAISQCAISQYKKIGILEEKIFPFGYFVPEIRRRNFFEDLPKKPSIDRVNIVFVGNLISRKGLDLLIEAVERLNLKRAMFTLTIYGSGDWSKFRLDGESLIYGGNIPFGDAQNVIKNYDFLVLPSRYDGWGVVVNESIMANVPVLVSDRVGSSSMVTKWGCGLVFDSTKVGDLDQKLLSLMDITLRHRLKENTKKLKKYLSPKFAGNYMYKVFLSRRDANLTRPEFPCYDFSSYG